MALVYESYGIDAGGVYRLGGHPYASVMAHSRLSVTAPKPWSVVIYSLRGTKTGVPREHYFDTQQECHDCILDQYAVRRLRGQNT